MATETPAPTQSDFPPIEQALQKSFQEVCPELTPEELTKLAHTATNTMKGLGVLVEPAAAPAPEPAPAEHEKASHTTKKP